MKNRRNRNEIYTDECCKCKVKNPVKSYNLSGTLNKPVAICFDCFGGMTNLQIKELIRSKNGR